MRGIPTQFLIIFIAVFFILILISSYFSIVETSYSSVNKIRLKSYVNERRKGAKTALHIADNFDEALSTILVGNNLVNIAAATISAQVTAEIFGPKIGVIVSTFGVTIMVLIVGDIVPKSLAKENAELCTLKTAGSLYVLMRIFRPITRIILKIPQQINRLFGKENIPSITEEEIKVMIDISEEEGVIDKEEKELVRRTLDFDHIIAGEILIPRPDILAVDIGVPNQDLKELFLKKSFSRIPIYEDNIDNIIGIITARDFLSALIQDGDFDLKDILKTPLFIPQSMRVANLLPKLQKQKNHMAIVTDEYGGTLGIVTLEDILEQIVGEICDEQDPKIDMLKKVDTNTYYVDAEYALKKFMKFFKVKINDTKAITLGGWLTEAFQKIPSEGEELDFKHLKFKIKDADEKRIIKVEVIE